MGHTLKVVWGMRVQIRVGGGPQAGPMTVDYGAKLFAKVLRSELRRIRPAILGRNRHR